MSQADIGEVRVTDPIPTNTTTVSASGTGAFTGCTAAALNGAGCLNTAALAPGDTATITYTVKVNSNTPNGFIDNTATVATVGASVSDPNLTNNSATTHTGVGPNADLQLTKTASAGPVTAGSGTITYTINITNSGPSNANGVVVTDNIPANTSLSGPPPTWTGPPAGSCSVSAGGTITCSPTAAGGVLNAGQSATITYTVLVGPSVPSGTLITNAANIASTGANATPDPNPANNTQNPTSTIVNTSANLSVTKTGPATAVAGTNISYTITVANPTGPSDAQNVVMTDQLPPLATFVSVTSSDTAFVCTTPAVGSSGTVTCTKPTLAVGASTTITLVVRVSPSTPSGTIISNQATVGSTTPDPVTSNNTSTPVVNTTISTSTTLAISKSDSPDPVVAGTNLTFTVTVINTGPSDAQNVTMTDPLPANTSFVSVVGSGAFSNAGACTHNGLVPGTVTCTALPGGVLPAGATATAVITVKSASSAPVSPPGPPIVNTASVSSPTDTGSPRTATSSTSVRREADMSLTKTAPASVIAGQNLDFTLTVKNNGPSDVAGGAAPGSIVVTDNLPAGTSFVSAVTSGPGNFTCAAAGLVITCRNAAGAPGDFPAGSVATIIIKAMAAKNLADNSNLNNTASVALTGPEVDPVPGNNTGASATVVHTSADLQVIKDVISPVPPAGVVAGQNITYRLRVLNNGPSNAVGVVVTDILPGNTTFVAGSITGTGVFASPACTYNPAGGVNGSITCVPNASPGPPPTVQGEFTCGIEETITFQVKVDPSVSGGSIVPNPARISSTTSDPNAGNNTSLGTSTAVIALANLAISKTVLSSTPAVDPGAPPGAVIPGTQLTYQIKVTNNGPSDVINVRVTDFVPANAKYVEVHQSGGFGTTFTCFPPTGIVDPNGNGGIVNCTAPLLSSSSTPTPGDPAGAQNMALINLTVLIDPATKVSLVNTATINATVNNYNQPVSATTTLTTPVSPTSDLVVTKSHTSDDTVAGTNTAGNTFTYTISVKNNGQSTAQMLTVTDTLPAGQTLASAPDVTAGAGLTCTPNTVGSGGVITCTGGTLAPNATAVVKLNVRIDPCQAPGIYNNVVTAASMSFDPNLANNTAIDPVTVVARPDLSIIKTAAAVDISGTGLTFTIVATNNGPSCALNVMITDPLPPNTVLASLVVSAGGVVDPSSPAIGSNGTVKVTWPGLTAPGVSRTVTIGLTLGAEITCTTIITNTATVSYTPRIPSPNPNPAIVWDVDPNLANNTSTANTTAQAQSDLSINKTGTAQAVFSTQVSTSTVTYTITFSNAGPSNSAGTMVVDTLPKGFTVVGTPTSTVPGTTFTITTTDGVTTVKANLGVLGALNQVGTNFPTSGTIVIVAKVPDKHPIVTVTNVATISTMNCLPDPNLANNTSSWDTLIVAPGGPGLSFPASSEVSDQKAGSVLFYPIYTSDAASPNKQNTRVSLTNVSDVDRVCVHLFVVEGSSCSTLDAYICLTPNQTTTFHAADFDPGNTGYMMAVAVDCMTGLPIAFNCLIGDAYVKFSTGHAANLDAEGIAAVMWAPAGTNPNVTSTTLRFDGMSYNRLPRILAADSIGSPGDGNSALLIIDRVGGDMQSSGASLGNLFGYLYNDVENLYSFTATSNACQFRALLNNTFPRTFVRFSDAVGAGRTGWMKIWAVDDKALFGVMLNFNSNTLGVPGAFSQGHNLHKLTLTAAATITVPVAIPNCQ